MAKKKKVNVVYSTNPSYGFDYGNAKLPASIAPNQQNLKVWLDRLKGGKTASFVRGYEGPESELKALGSKLKSICGGGGAVKNGEIMIQGDHRDKILDYLLKNGYGAKKAGG